MEVENPKRKEKLSAKDVKRNRLVILLVLGITLLASAVVVLYRDRRVIIAPFLEPQVVISTLIEPKASLSVPKFEKETAEIKDLVKDLKGSYGILVQDLATGESYGLNEKEIFTAASLIKLPVLLTLYKEAEAGNLSLGSQYLLRAEDKRGGAGSMQYQPAGAVYTYREMAELMGQQSDNTAFNVLVNVLKEQKIQQLIDQLGMMDTSFEENETTPKDIGLFFYKLYKGNFLIRDHRDELFNFLTKTIWEERIPAGIPQNVRVVHKIGTEIGVVSDAGIVFSRKPFILVILSEKVNETEAKEILPRIAALVYRQRGGE